MKHIQEFISFRFNKRFILVRVTVDPERILGTQGLEYTLDGIPVYYKAPCTHTQTKAITPSSNSVLFWRWEEPEHLKESPIGHREKCETLH